MGLEKYYSILSERPEWGNLATFVPNKRLPVYNWLYFKEGFSRDLVMYLLDLFGVRRGNCVFDPFCGSGTTLLACKERGVDSMGTDLLPLSVFASRVKTAHYDTELLREAAKDIFSRGFVKVPFSFPYQRFFNRHSLEDIMLFRQIILDIPSPKTRDFFLLALITSAMKISWVWKDGNVLKAREHPVPPFRKFFKKKVLRMIKEIEKFPSLESEIIVERSPSSETGLKNQSIDAVITSPPYLNQIDYSKIYSIENWFLGHDLQMDHYVGFEKERIYLHDMKKTLEEIFRVCKKGAQAAIVVGNAYFPDADRIVENDLLFAQMAEEIGFTARHIYVLNKRFALQRRTIKKGVLRESIVFLEK